MSYARVIPRDFFNEAKLLKCMGQLALKILDRQLPDGLEIEIKQPEDGDAFEINKDIDGNISVSNYTVTVNDIPLIFYTIENSRAAYPFYCLVIDEVSVFDEWGEFTDEFRNLKLKTI